MSLLAHDQVWNADDWWVLVWFPPVMFFGALAILLICLTATKREDENLRDFVKFGAAFIGIPVVGAMLFIYSLVGLYWVMGWEML